MISLTMAADGSATSFGIANSMALSTAGNSLSLAPKGRTLTGGSPPFLTLTGSTCNSLTLGMSLAIACTVTVSETPSWCGTVVTLTDVDVVLKVPTSVKAAE